MNNERDRKHATQSSETTELDTFPGRASKSAGLERRTTPVPSGIVMRKGEGDVAADADALVANASSGSGNSLPDDLRTRFEDSLGTDLSSVRVHTGAESQAAASAVSARAFAVGNDVHFGAGQYDPSSAGGQHLIAHEVAHTVQQRGSAPSRQNKLEVSTASDSFEHDADRAADAMVRGAPASVSSAGVGIHRRPDDRNPLTGEPSLPRPLYWDSAVDADIEGAWTGNPVFTHVATGDLSPAGVAWTTRVGRMKEAFTAAWTQGQTNWAGAVPAFQEYREAAKDAENKGLADFGGKGSDIDLDAEQEDFGGKTNVSDANLQDHNKIVASKAFDAKKVDAADPKLRRSLAPLKTAKEHAQRGMEKSERAIDTARDKLSIAHLKLASAAGSLSAKQDSKQIDQLNREIRAYQKASALCGTALGAMTKAEGTKAGALQGGAAALQMINTFAWEAAIHQVESQVQVLQGGIQQTEIDGAKNVADIARLEVAIAVRAIKDAIDDYKTACANYKQKYADLAEALEKTTLASTGGNAKMASRVRAAVEAIPLMELTVQKCQALQARCVTVPESMEARAGGGMTSNGGELSHHNGVLVSWKGQMSDAVAKWTKRLTLAKQLVSDAQ